MESLAPFQQRELNCAVTVELLRSPLVLVMDNPGLRHSLLDQKSMEEKGVHLSSCHQARVLIVRLVPPQRQHVAVAAIYFIKQ